MQQTSKWEKHLPYLHVLTLSVHNSVSENLKFQRKYQHMDAILDNRASQYAHVLGPVERS